MLSPKQILDLLKDSYGEWKDDKASRLAAALSYYTVFSLAPLLVIAIGVASLLWDRQAVEAQVLAQMQGLIGPEGAEFITALLSGMGNDEAGLLATMLGTITLIFGALGVFGELHNALNTIWEVKNKQPEGLMESIRRLFQDRALAFTMVLGVGFLLLVSLVVSAGLASLEEVLGAALPIPELLLQAINLVISIGLVTLLFAMIYKFLPDAHIAWRDVWLGAGFTAVLFSIGKFLIGLYLGNSAVGSTFGAAGALALILLWVYYSAQILFFGAEFTQVYANTYGSRIRPDEDAISLVATSTEATKQEDETLMAPAHSTSQTLSSDKRQEQARQMAMAVSGLVASSFIAGFLMRLGRRK